MRDSDPPSKGLPQPKFNLRQPRGLENGLLGVTSHPQDLTRQQAARAKGGRPLTRAKYLVTSSRKLADGDNRDGSAGRDLEAGRWTRGPNVELHGVGNLQLRAGTRAGYHQADRVFTPGT